MCFCAVFSKIFLVFRRYSIFNLFQLGKDTIRPLLKGFVILKKKMFLRKHSKVPECPFFTKYVFSLLYAALLQNRTPIGNYCIYSVLTIHHKRTK